MRLVLASASPRRRQLLETLSLDFDVVPAGVDETRFQGEPPTAYVERIAESKARAVLEPGRVVIGCDTTVVHEGKVLGKPSHPEEARSMLRRLEGDVHEVFTGIAVGGFEDDRAVLHSVVDVAEVEFLPLTDGEIRDYVATGEPMDKAGSYALQGLGGVFIKRIKGSPFTVIGMPIHLLPRLISAVGADMTFFRVPTDG